MRLRYGIPFMILLAALASLASCTNGFNAFTVLVGITAVWIAYDSYTVRARDYRTPLGQHPLALALLAIPFWPIVLPGWLRTRRRIRLGEVERGAAPRWPLGCAAATVVVPVFLAGIVWLASADMREESAELKPLLLALDEEYGDARSLKLSRSPAAIRVTLGLRIPEQQLDTHSLGVARFVTARVDSLSSVSVTYVDVRERGAVSWSSTIGSRTWTARQIAEAEARESMPRDSLRRAGSSDRADASRRRSRVERHARRDGGSGR